MTITHNEGYTGKVAFVTGAANGIGRASALAFARKGASVAAGKMRLTTLVVALSVASNLTPPQASSEGTLNMKINITVSGKTVTAVVVDNPTAREFASRLPLKMSMEDLFGREKFAHLQEALSEKGPRTKTYQVGDIAYWSPTHDIAIYYRQDGESIPAPGVIPIARITGSTDVFNVPGSVKVSIEIAK